MFEDSSSEEDDDENDESSSKGKNETKVNSNDKGVFSISANLFQRKLQQQQQRGAMNAEDNENRMMNDDTKKMNISDAAAEFELSDSASFASESNSVENFKRSINNWSGDDSLGNNFTRNPVDRMTKSNNKGNDEGKTQSFIDYLKSLFSCKKKKKSKKINEQIESDYPMNLHLRMNEIFAMHDKLSDIAEDLNDLYSIGEENFSRYWHLTIN